MNREIVPFRDILVNQRLQLRVAVGGDGRRQSLASRVEDVNRQAIVVAHPTAEGALVDLPRGTPVEVAYADDAALYRFVTRVRGRILRPAPQLELERPEQVVRIQRREFVRLALSLPVRLRVLALPGEEAAAEEGLACHHGRTRDVSAGGAHVLTSAPLPRGTIVELEVELRPGECFLALGEVVRREPAPPELGPDVVALGVNFLGLELKEQHYLVNFVFQQQRELRKKGLL